MKKQFLSMFAAVAALSGMAQTPSPSWTINQSAGFTASISGTKYLDVLDANVVWAAGYDGQSPNMNYNWISHTTNGGATWTVNNAYPDTNTYDMANMEGIDANTCWVSAFMKASQSQGAIHRTTNGGATWTNMTAPGMFTNTSAFTDFVTFVTPSLGVVVGDPVNNVFEIWRTQDGGTTWTLVPSSAIPAPLAGEYGIVDLYCKEGSSNIWFGTQKGRIYRSFDAGQTWNVGVVGAITLTITELEFSSQMNGVAYGVNGSTFEVYNTTNGGATWTQIPQDPNLGRNDMCHIPGTNYYASTDNGNQMISYSKDNGVTWTSWGSTGLPYLKVDFSSPVHGWSGAFSAFPTSTIGGVWKYNGVTFNSNFTVSQFVCKPIGNATVSPVNSSTAATLPLTYTWSANSGAVSFSSANATVPVITFTANGTYTINLAAGNTQGTSNSSQVVTVLTCSTPIAGFNAPASVCNNIALTLTNTSVGAPNPSITITTNPANNVTVTPGSGSLYTLKFATAGVYTINLLASSAAGTSAVTQTVNVNSCNPVVNFSVPSLFYRCSNVDRMPTANTTTAPVTGLITYTWSSLPSAGVTFSPSATASNVSIAFNSSVTSVYTITLRATNSSGTASAVQTVTMDFCTGIIENKNLMSNLDVFPNPAKESLHISLPSGIDLYQVKLVNVLGAVVYDEKIVNKENTVINLSNKPKGVYFLTVIANNEKVTKKIILE